SRARWGRPPNPRPSRTLGVPVPRLLASTLRRVELLLPLQGIRPRANGRHLPRLATEPVSQSEIQPVSQSEIELAAAGGPAPLDGGFARTGKPASVFPPSLGDEATRDDFTSDAEPVSLHDLGVVLGRAPVPPAWSGGTAREDAATRETAQKPSVDAKPSFFQVDLAPPPQAAPKRREELRGPDSGHEDLRRLVAQRDDSPARHGNSDIF